MKKLIAIPCSKEIEMGDIVFDKNKSYCVIKDYLSTYEEQINKGNWENVHLYVVDNNAKIKENDPYVFNGKLIYSASDKPKIFSEKVLATTNKILDLPLISNIEESLKLVDEEVDVEIKRESYENIDENVKCFLGTKLIAIVKPIINKSKQNNERNCDYCKWNINEECTHVKTISQCTLWEYPLFEPKVTSLNDLVLDKKEEMDHIISQSQIEFPDCNTKSDQETINMFRNIWIKGVNYQKEQDSKEFECIRSFIRTMHLTNELRVYSIDYFNFNENKNK